MKQTWDTFSTAHTIQKALFPSYYSSEQPFWEDMTHTQKKDEQKVNLSNIHLQFLAQLILYL